MEACLFSESVDETRQLAAALAPLLIAGDTIVLNGAMGTGKTFFVQALLAQLNPDQLVQSPTFSLVNVYETPDFPVYHVDFYRLNSEGELWAAGWEDYLDDKGTLLIEWGQRFPQALPLSFLQIDFVATGESGRRLLLSSQGERGEQLQEEWLNAVASH
ncbi:MAG: tRNA (adenosine(37)-N6)-threonylcarbamoyltransferase complex ATPase subunit type 1 TsaE [Firmicutes bacterium]|nr:tRNA (adenosine(37)-N6)-threonylcarbamoyltransferase complex ATPase subunit type 1 TsaE [Bacillota bacterium]